MDHRSLLVHEARRAPPFPEAAYTSRTSSTSAREWKEHPSVSSNSRLDSDSDTGGSGVSTTSSVAGRRLKFRAKRKELLAVYHDIPPEKIFGRVGWTTLISAILFALACFGVFGVVTVEYRRFMSQEKDVVLLEALEVKKRSENVYRPLGCFALLGNDAAGPASLRDKSCLDPAKHGLVGQRHCRSGLPFYRFVIPGGEVMPWRLCAELCLLKGLDVSGVVDAVECRCGASHRNIQVWASALGLTNQVRPDLRFQEQDAVVEPNSSDCRIIAASYTGVLPVHPKLLDVLEVDLSYVRSIVLSSTDAVVESYESHKPLPAYLNRLKADSGLPQSMPIGLSWKQRALNSSCYPDRCSTGWAWPIWTTYDFGIPFAFDETVTGIAKSSVRHAIQVLHDMTCIKFTEVSLGYDTFYKIRITMKEEGPCWASPMGFPGSYFTDSVVNLYSCPQDVGVVIHELAHALGMSHEQSRQDRDDYVSINWANIAADWRDQYKVSPASYIGSNHLGYIRYDFDSIMHYAASKALRSRPVRNGVGTHDARLGQRNGLSPLDIVQLRDMYQCDAPVLDCVDQDPEAGSFFQLGEVPAQCADISALCDHAFYGQSISYFCAKSCNACPKTVPVSRAEGKCEDTNKVLCRYMKDFCPGENSGIEEFMSRNCAHTCCNPEVCTGCQRQSSAASAIADSSEHGAKEQEAVAMYITFSNRRWHVEVQLQLELQTSLSAVFGLPTLVKLLKVPQCSQGACTGGKAFVSQPCNHEATTAYSPLCAEALKRLLDLRPNALSRELVAARSHDIITIDDIDVVVDFTLGNLSTFLWKHRIYLYIAASLAGLAFMLLAFALCWRRWWSLAEAKVHRPAALGVVGIGVDDFDAEGNHVERQAKISAKSVQDFMDSTIGEDAYIEKVEGLFAWPRLKCSLLGCCLLLAIVVISLLVYVFVDEATESTEESEVDLLFPPLEPVDIPAYKVLGCFSLSPGDGLPAPSLYDVTCMERTAPMGVTHCRSGLPYYRLRFADSSGSGFAEIGSRTCFRFCLQRGLDISGVVDSVECRCGSSQREDLTWQFQGAVPENSDQCRIVVSKLVGASQSSLLHETALAYRDIVYASTIRRGSPIDDGAGSDVPNKTVAPGLRDCRADLGCSAGQIWPLGESIGYSFAANLRNSTKEVFLKVTAHVSRKTCITFREVGPSVDARIRVSDNSSACRASFVGFSTTGVDLELGWCNSLQSFGEVLHELGHILGMANEEQRADRDLYLLKAQEEQLDAAYVGSKDFGPMDYDYRSVMHGSPGTGLTSRPAVGFHGAHDPETGQRHELSDLDVLKLSDMYGCQIPPEEEEASSLCIGLSYRCPLGTPAPGLETWLAKHCRRSCGSDLKAIENRSKSLTFDFVPGQGFDDLDTNPDQARFLGRELAKAVSSALGSQGGWGEVSGSCCTYTAALQVPCGCTRSSGSACVACSTMEDRLRNFGKPMLKKALVNAGLASFDVIAVHSQMRTWEWFVTHGALWHISLLMAGIAFTCCALLQVSWLIWWNTSTEVDFPELGEDQEKAIQTAFHLAEGRPSVA